MRDALMMAASALRKGRCEDLSPDMAAALIQAHRADVSAVGVPANTNGVAA